MGEVKLSCERALTCPQCGAYLYQEVLEDEKKVNLFCQENGCNYENIAKYECLRFSFTYRDEFTTEVVAKNLDEAMKKLDHANWQRTVHELWEEYLDVEYNPIFEVK